MKVETRMWNQLHSDTKGNCEPKRCLVLDHIEFTCGIQVIIEVINRGKRLCFCSLLNHPQKVNTVGTTNEILSPCFVSLSLSLF